MATRKVDTASLTAVANAIRTAANSSDPLTFPAGFVSAVQNLSAGSGNTEFLVGIQSISSTAEYTFDNLPFTPNKALLVLVRRSATKGALVTAASDPLQATGPSYGLFSNGSSGFITNISSNNFTFGQNSVTYTALSSFSINGTYIYVFWREGATA